MNLRLGTTKTALGVLLCVSVTLMLCSYGGAAASAAAAATQAKPRLVVYAGGESPGIEVQSRADATHLRGAPKSFKRFIGRKAQRLADQSTCSYAYVGVTVERLRTDGFAVGGVNDCGGYAALWAVVHGHWKEIQGTQEIWSCAILKGHHVPSSVAGDTCYDYKAQRVRHYHHR
ncbi:hypothetical protein GCM10023350_13530 [Nocardioides endophyticus]|uniref:Uncharacterized protein n=1 Tax=Nocardioides endophyticus TaxID=1353775 RepID=A0ABP8YKL8_9ACTN